MYQRLQNMGDKPSYFNWKKRYEIHQMFHQTRANKWAHFLATPIQFFGIIKLFALCSFPLFLGIQLNLAILLILFLSTVYCLIHARIGFMVALYLSLCFYLSTYHPLFTQWQLELLFAIAIFSSGALIQVGVGHKVFERKNANLASEFSEFFQTYNPMIFILIFFFPFLDFFKMISGDKK